MESEKQVAPSPAGMVDALKRRKAAEKAAELAELQRVKKRARMRSHVDDSTLLALGKLAQPVPGVKRRRPSKRRPRSDEARAARSNGTTAYVVCNRLMDPEENLHCEFDGEVEFVEGEPAWCPWCRGRLPRP